MTHTSHFLGPVQFFECSCPLADKSKSPDPDKKRIGSVTEACCENELKTSSSLADEAPTATAKDVLEGNRSFAEILFQRVMKVG